MKLNEVPILDCSDISGPLEGIENTDTFKNFTNRFGDGMRNIGFVYLINHGVSSQTIENAYAKSREFFELPKEVKLKYRKIDPAENFHGFTPSEDEIVNENDKSKPEHKEAFDFWGLQAFDKVNYPSEVPGLKAAFDEYRSSLKLLTKKLLRSLAVYLQLDDVDFFIKHHKALDNQKIMSPTDIRTNYFMPLNTSDVEINENVMRLSEHNDWDTITFLIQDDCGGLEAKKPNGEWISVPPLKDSIVLNAGLMLEMWSGGHLPATPHRVRMLKNSANKLRQSIGLFVHPDGDSKCMPVIPEKTGWTSTYPKMGKETHLEYTQNRIRGSRAY